MEEKIIIDFPLFPLSLIAFPGEEMKLHIFEPRYKQLIKDCLDGNIQFGIPSVLEGKFTGFGTSMKLKEVVHTYNNGNMDIIVKGTGWFELISYKKMLEGKLYPAGNIKMMPWNDSFDILLSIRLKKLIAELYELMNITNVHLNDDETFRTYQIAHKVGLSPEQELEFLQIPGEAARQQYLIDHLGHLIPVVKQAEALKKKAEQNGHFPSFSLPDF